MDVPDLGGRELGLPTMLLIFAALVLGLPLLQAGLKARAEKQILDRSDRSTPAAWE